MNWASGEIVGVLTFLLPGFIAAAIFYALTSHPRRGAFDRVLLALIFTFICQAITEWVTLGPIGFDDGSAANDNREPLLSIVVAIALGLCVSAMTNTDVVHRFFRRLRIARETSFPSEWYSTFARYGENCHVVIHLRSGRRLYGFAEEWPSDPKDGHFRLAKAEWLDEEGKRTLLSGVAAVLIPATEVSMPDFGAHV